MKIPGLNQLKVWLKKHWTNADNTPLNHQQPTTNHRLSSLVEQNIIPGMALSIYRGAELLFRGGIGYADLEKKIPVDPEKTLFRAASVSKPITACALAALLAEGQMDLDHSFYKYVPYFPRKKHDFTIKQLAAHTAGIRGYRGKEYALNKPFTIPESLQVFQRDPLLFEPGTQFHYNSFGYVLLSLAMEEATGIPFADYAREKVLVPLQMSNTLPEIPDTNNEPPTTNNEPTTTINQPPPTTFYTRWGTGFRKARPVDNRFKLAGGGYLTTTEDLVKLGRAILEKRFHPGEMAFMLEPQKIKGKSTYYGLGWEVSQDSKGRRYFGHIGNQVGGYSYFKIFPETGLIVAALVNCTAPKIQDVLDGVVEEFQNS